MLFPEVSLEIMTSFTKLFSRAAKAHKDWWALAPAKDDQPPKVALSSRKTAQPEGCAVVFCT
jgi:hypothetical protein